MEYSLEDLRKEMDAIDDEFIKLFVKRQETAVKIGEYKKENNIPVTVSSREAEVINRLKTKAAQEYGDDIEELYKTVFSLSKKRQNNV